MALLAVLIIQFAARLPLEHPSPRSLRIALVAVVGAAVLLLLLGKWHVAGYRGERQNALKLWMLAVAVLVTGEGTVSGILYLISDRLKTRVGLILTIVVVLLLVVSSMLAFKHREYWRPQIDEPQGRPPRRAKALVLFLSRLDPRRIRIEDGNVFVTADGDPSGSRMSPVPAEMSPADALVYVSQGPAPEMVPPKGWATFPWEMPLIAVFWHTGRHPALPVKSKDADVVQGAGTAADGDEAMKGVASPLQVILVCSAQSAPQCRAFVELIRPQVPAAQAAFWSWVATDTPRLVGEEGMTLMEKGELSTGLSFEDVDATYETLRTILDVIPQTWPDITEADVIIDVTGGQKTNSIAAGMLTVDRLVNMQYVQTNEPKWPRCYDYRSAPRAGFGHS
jgi:hypothetical protein